MKKNHINTPKKMFFFKTNQSDNGAHQHAPEHFSLNRCLTQL